MAGQSEPVRVTYTVGFDGLPVFTPDGRQLAWTTNRTPGNRSQIFLADWNHVRARQLLGLEPTKPTGFEPSTDTTASKSTATETGATETGTARAAAGDSYQLAVADYAAEDIRRHVAYLCRPELAGRMTGTSGEQLATAYVAAYFQRLGLQPAGDQGSWFQTFQFTSGVALEENNRLASGSQPYRLNHDWRPLSFSGTGQFKSAPLVFAGYGMDVPVGESQDAYDSYTHLDVRDKWVLAFRYLPTDAKSFYVHGVPVLSAFTGSHAQYHTPRDTPERLNYEGAAAVARLMGLITRSLGCRDAPPDYLEQAARLEQPRGMLRAYLGTIPDYAQEVVGVLLSGVRKEGPAARAGVRGGDIIVELAGKKIENIYDYTHAIEGLKIEQPVKMAVRRGKQRVVLEVVPGSRE